MLERLKNLKTTGSGIIIAIITIAALFGIDLEKYKELMLAIIGVLGTVIGLFAKDK